MFSKIKIDIPFFISVLILTLSGYLIFSSASLGLLTSNLGKYSNVTFNQTFFGLFLGTIACLITSNIPYTFYRKYAFYIFLASIIATLLVFVPHIGFAHGGAKRWLNIGSFSLQPSEFLKIGYIIYFSAWLSSSKNKAQTFKKGFLPFILVTAVIGAILLKQPDTDTFLVALFAGIAIFISAGGSWKHIIITGIIGILGIATVAYFRPYVMSRITTFIHPESDSLGSGYQIQQSMIAIGSGGLYGRGYGQSIQKFNYLPEPIGDSIFAVEGEEFGFLGTTLLILFFVFFAIRGLKISSMSKDPFGRLLGVGIVILVVSQAFVNIGAMSSILPLSGIPLPFVSHGGTSLLITLAEMGILFNISKTVKKT
jgi:cell division protein FtsW